MEALETTDDNRIQVNSVTVKLESGVTGTSTRSRRPAKRFTILAIGMLILAAILSPVIVWFNLIQVLPDEERYYYINQLLEEIDYESAGVVTREEYDDSQANKINPARFEATIQGLEAFEVLSSRIESSKRDCRSFDTVVACDKGRPQVRLTAENNNTVHLILNDSGAGRD